GLSRHELIGGKVVPQPLDEPLRDIRDVHGISPDTVTLQNRDDFVVRRPLIQSAQASDNSHREKHLCSRDRTLAQHAYIKRIPIATLGTRQECRNSRTTERPRNKPVESRGERRTSLRSVHPQITRHLVYLVFDRIEWSYFDVCLEHPRWIGSRSKTMPRVRTPTIKHQSLDHRFPLIPLLHQHLGAVQWSQTSRVHVLNIRFWSPSDPFSCSWPSPDPLGMMFSSPCKNGRLSFFP
ncbi:MAG: hypothetical protein H6Q48_3241, partial [Deltaproteobacteria bacterium]|nr:hypothetical protein [Deltaproteobacteria bacterium]